MILFSNDFTSTGSVQAVVFSNRNFGYASQNASSSEKIIHFHFSPKDFKQLHWIYLRQQITKQ